MPNSSVSDKKLKHYPNGLACNTVHGYRLRLNFKCKAPALFQFFIENMHVMLKNARVKLISSIPEHKCLSSRQSQLKQHELEKKQTHVQVHTFLQMLPSNSSPLSAFLTNAFLAIIEGANFSLITLFLCGYLIWTWFAVPCTSSKFDRSPPRVC